MRILFIATDFPSPHHATRGVFNLNLVQGLAQEHEVRVISPIPWTDQSHKKGGAMPGDRRVVIGPGVEAHYPTYYYPPKLLRNRYSGFYWRSICATAYRVISEGRPDIVIGYWAHPDGDVAMRIARLLGVPGAIIIGGSDVLILTGDRRRRRCVASALGRADAVFALSEHLRQAIIDLGASAEKVHVWRRGIDTARFAPGPKDEARRRLDIPADCRMAVWVGRVVPVKGLDVLLKACRLLRDRGVVLRVYLVGEGG